MVEEVGKKSKLRTYRIFKNPRLRPEKYLLTARYYWGRTLMTDLRIGTNRLEIERGRWEKKKAEDRLCRQCSLNEVEDEYHL